MSGLTDIQWVDLPGRSQGRSFNPLAGCTEASPGCWVCYAKMRAWRFAHSTNAKIRATYEGLTYKGADGRIRWTGEIRLLQERMEEPLAWRQSCGVFLNSMTDLFHEKVPIEFVAEVWSIMAVTRHLWWLILTKRHDIMRQMLTDPRFPDLVDQAMKVRAAEHGWCLDELEDWPLPNVALLVSTERQKELEKRVPDLLASPAVVHGLSCEPLLERLNLYRVVPHVAFTNTGDPVTCRLCNRLVMDECHRSQLAEPLLDWTLWGGESGPKARAFDEQWVRDGIAQSRAIGAAPFVKQFGTRWAKQHKLRTLHAGSPDLWPVDLRVREFPALFYLPEAAAVPA